jgi:hypothetical protein
VAQRHRHPEKVKEANRMMSQATSTFSRILFVTAFVLAILAIGEKLVNLLGFHLIILGGYLPSRLLELATIALLFVIALQLREIKQGVSGTREAS